MSFSTLVFCGYIRKRSEIMEKAIVRETLQQGIECDENEVDLRFRLLDRMQDDGYQERQEFKITALQII